MNVHFGPLESRDFGEGLRLKFRNRRVKGSPNRSSQFRFDDWKLQLIRGGSFPRYPPPYLYMRVIIWAHRHDKRSFRKQRNFVTADYHSCLIKLKFL